MIRVHPLPPLYPSHLATGWEERVLSAALPLVGLHSEGDCAWRLLPALQRYECTINICYKE